MYAVKGYGTFVSATDNYAACSQLEYRRSGWFTLADLLRVLSHFATSKQCHVLRIEMKFDSVQTSAKLLWGTLISNGTCSIVAVIFLLGPNSESVQTKPELPIPHRTLPLYSQGFIFLSPVFSGLPSVCTPQIFFQHSTWPLNTLFSAFKTMFSWWSFVLRARRVSSSTPTEEEQDNRLPSGCLSSCLSLCGFGLALPLLPGFLSCGIGGRGLTSLLRWRCAVALPFLAGLDLTGAGLDGMGRRLTSGMVSMFVWLSLVSKHACSPRC